MNDAVRIAFFFLLGFIAWALSRVADDLRAMRRMWEREFERQAMERVERRL